LDDAGAHFAQHVGEREDLLLVRPQGRDVHALRVVMAAVARHRQAERAAFHAVAHDRLHLLQFGVGRDALLALVTHHVIAHRGVPDQRADIDPEMPVEPVHVLREGLPIDLDRVQDLHRDRFDIREELGHAFGLATAHRRQRQRAIADNDAGRAVVARERAQRIPGDLGVIVAVIVDKARGDRLTADIDDRVGSTRQFADLDDLAVLDGDIAMERRHARAVDDPAVLDQNVVRHLVVLLFAPGCRQL
jgi:hypothetical protein